MLQVADGRTDVHGLYDPEAATIYLRDDWDAASLRGRASLLHELVHHTQEFNKVSAPCRAERDRVAYELTLEWLRQQGAADPYGVLDTDDFTIIVRSMCPEQ